MTTKRLYVGNLPPQTTTEEIRDVFSQFGRVISVTFAEDRFSGSPRGFGYVEMEDGDAAAIAGLNRAELRGQQLTVCGARPKGEPAERGLHARGGPRAEGAQASATDRGTSRYTAR